jgi:hypothetical protein
MLSSIGTAERANAPLLGVELSRPGMAKRPWTLRDGLATPAPTSAGSWASREALAKEADAIASAIRRTMPVGARARRFGYIPRREMGGKSLSSSFIVSTGLKGEQVPATDGGGCPAMNLEVSHLLLQVDEAWLDHLERIRCQSDVAPADIELEEVLFGAGEWLHGIHRQALWAAKAGGAPIRPVQAS